MELKGIRDCLYKDNGEFSVLFDEVMSVNSNFKTVLRVKKQYCLSVLKEHALVDVQQKDKANAEKMLDAMIEIIFKNIDECHTKLYQ
jgi:hypothetical protein